MNTVSNATLSAAPANQDDAVLRRLNWMLDHQARWVPDEEGIPGGALYWRQRRWPAEGGLGYLQDLFTRADTPLQALDNAMSSAGWVSACAGGEAPSSGAREVPYIWAWQHQSDDFRVISAAQKADALAAPGWAEVDVRPYSVPLYRGQPS